MKNSTSSKPVYIAAFNRFGGFMYSKRFETVKLAKHWQWNAFQHGIYSEIL